MTLLVAHNGNTCLIEQVHHPYGRALTVEEAILELKRCTGSQFDPLIINLFIEKVLPNFLLKRKIEKES